MHAITWNVGGLTPTAALQLLGDLRKERIWPFSEPLVTCLQEIIVDEGKFEFESGDFQMYAGKLQGEWRGTAIAHDSLLQHSRSKLLKAGTCCTLASGKFSMMVLSGHVPHHATLLETEEIFSGWKHQVTGEGRCMVGLDANESFKPGRGQAVISDSARGEFMLGEFVSLGLRLQPQDLHSPSYYPYNTQMRPRRLDYIFTRHLLADRGGLLDCRDLARSDHEPVHLSLAPPEIRPHPKPDKTWGIRKLRPQPVIESILADFTPTSGDPVSKIASIAVQITKPGRQTEQYREGRELRLLRRRIIHMQPGEERKQLWKTLAKQRRAEHRAWCQAKLNAAGEGFWQSKKAVDQDKHDNSWELRLRGQDRWRETLAEHFGNIFNKLDSAMVADACGGFSRGLHDSAKTRPGDLLARKRSKLFEKDGRTASRAARIAYLMRR